MNISTKLPQLEKALLNVSKSDKNAAAHVGKLLGEWCKECGIKELMWVKQERKLHGKVKELLLNASKNVSIV